MGCDTYSVWVDAVPIARYMSIKNALILVEALFSEWWRETDISITIRKEKDGESDGRTD